MSYGYIWLWVDCGREEREFLGVGGCLLCFWRISVIRCTVDIQPHFSVTLDNIYITFQLVSLSI